ncbi:hypothetical protein JCGZ_27048 [Jatropha curcas]|uniref:Aminotransferase-like plant mobile domain-containing protein n=1 Tax=Jatropha curcas TaxID=180498 RepID=A0A067LG22_JATCU|nr:hypothetical protein JCGZ_27048 [Jatropha curcas]
MRYALMERWNDCTHTFVFGFGEMTLTPVDYAAITGLRFTGPVPPLDARYQTATLGAQLGVRPAAPAYTREERDQAARSFLFYIISSQLLCTSQNKGDPAVLACLRDLSQELENGRLRRHQSRQSTAVSRLQAEVEQLRTRLEVEGIPLDSSDEDEDGSSLDGAPPSPPPPTVAGPSRRRR